MTVPPRIASITQVRKILVRLFRKRLGRRFKAGEDYFLYELWSMDHPPDVLENTGMADRLDRILGFHLTEEELMTAYDAPFSVSSVYLFNLYQETRGKDAGSSTEVVKMKKSLKQKK
jgi:hypothetical protein